MRLFNALLLSALLPAASLTAAFAAGSDDSAEPATTETTTTCTDGMVFDDKTKTCVAPTSGQLDDDQRFDAVREFAFAGRYGEASAVLAAMTEGETDRVMTERGFLLRKTGHIEEGIAAYEAALALNPDNILTHSYYGQLLVEMDEVEAAKLHLAAIRAAGGSGTWAETALAQAIETGVTYRF